MTPRARICDAGLRAARIVRRSRLPPGEERNSFNMAMKDIPFEVELEEKEQHPADPSPDVRPLPHDESEEGPPVFTVSQLTRHIRGLLEEEFPIVLVEGELSNVKAASSGHRYFNLKDAGAQIRCVMFRAAASSLRFEPEDGLQVLLRGRLSVYETRGEYQLQVLALEPRGTGALQLAFEQLKRRLEGEGLFDPAHKQPLPFLPRRIGIVTSARGAAIRDMLHVLERRFPGLPVLLYPATVQGDQAPAEIAEGLAALNRLAPAEKIDLIIVGRGGGSVEDLWAFNSETVARAIFASRVPVISAVGHEVDFTIADFVADLRAPTPSAAAELAVPERAELLATVAERRDALRRLLAQTLNLRLERWSALRARLTSPEALMRQVGQRLDDLWERIALAERTRRRRAAERYRDTQTRLRMLSPARLAPLHRVRAGGLAERLFPALQRLLEEKRARLTAQMEVLGSLSPLTVMQRGYAIVRDPTGALVRAVAGVRPGDALDLRLADGALDAEVRAVRPDPAQDD
jgi:exodeoxyribonuclease VII large subunit